jgi:hypothetical protein
VGLFFSVRAAFVGTTAPTPATPKTKISKGQSPVFSGDCPSSKKNLRLGSVKKTKSPTDEPDPDPGTE